LVCGGGVAATAGLFTVTSRAIKEQVRVVIGEYFDDLTAKRYDKAYDRQCQDVKDEESRAEFTRRVTENPITSYKIGTVDLAAVELAVPVDATYTDGDTAELQVHLGQDTESGRLQVCGVEE
jgi:hypothetical protein